MNFYKITNKKEIHHGLKYKTCLNKMKPGEKFNPSGDCIKGGIYFSREDILAFLGYGIWIREVTLPRDARIYENPGEPKKWKADKVILGPRRKITLEVIKELVEEGANIHADNDYALRWAAKMGHLEIVKFLVKHGANVHAGGDYASRWAASNGRLEIVKFLVKHCANVHAGGDYASRWAAKMGHLEIVKFLVKYGADKGVLDELL